MKSVIEHNEIGIFTPIDQMERQFKYKSAAHVSQLKEDRNGNKTFLEKLNDFDEGNNEYLCSLNPLERERKAPLRFMF